MFFRTKQSKYNAAPGSPNPVFTRQMQEILGGQWGAINVMIGYPFQGWNCRRPTKYRDMLLDIATEEAGRVEITHYGRLPSGDLPGFHWGGGD